MTSIADSYTDEVIKLHNAYEYRMAAYAAENAWWYHFFQAAGSSSYDVEYANSLRIDGISPEEAAEIIKNS